MSRRRHRAKWFLGEVLAGYRAERVVLPPVPKVRVVATCPFHGESDQPVLSEHSKALGDEDDVDVDCGDQGYAHDPKGWNTATTFYLPEKVRIRCHPDPQVCRLDEQIRLTRLEALLDWMANRGDVAEWILSAPTLNALLRQAERWDEALSSVGRVSYV